VPVNGGRVVRVVEEDEEINLPNVPTNAPIRHNNQEQEQVSPNISINPSFEPFVF